MKKIFIPFIVIFLVFVFACSSNKSVKKTSLFEPEAEFKEVNEKMKKGDYENARELLADIKARDTSGKYSSVAGIRIGDTYFEEGSFEEAAFEYEQFLNMHPYHKYSSYAQYKLAMSYSKRIKTVDISYSTAKRALEEFEKLLRVYPRNPFVSVVENRIKTCKNILAEYEFYVSKFYFKKGSYEAAAERLNGLLQNYPDSRKGAESLYYLGLSYKKIGKRDKSVETLTSLIDKYPTTELSKEAKEIIASLNKKKK